MLAKVSAFSALVALAVIAPGCSAEVAEPASVDAEDGQENLGTAPDARSIVPRGAPVRRLTCPLAESSAEGSFRGKPLRYVTASEVDRRRAGWEARASIDDHALDGLVPADMNALLVDVRLVNGEPAFAYLGANGKLHETFEPWSSAKLVAASAAMARVRRDSAGAVGGPAKVNGTALVGDLVTTVHTYAPSGGSTGSSNAIAGYFLTVAGAAETNALLRDGFLRLTNDASEFHVSTAAGRTRSAWGENPFFSSGAGTWVMPDGARFSPKRDTEMVDDKPMSVMALGEWLLRLGEHERLGGSIPGLTDDDVATLFYGADPARYGGMSAGLSSYLANAVAASGPADDANATRAKLEEKAGADFRIFHKIGWGTSTTRSKSELIVAAYGCFPKLGREMVLVTRVSQAPASGAVVGNTMQKHVDAIVGAALGR